VSCALPRAFRAVGTAKARCAPDEEQNQNLKHDNHQNTSTQPKKRQERETIAIFHCSIKIISRGKGKSAVASAAYRAGEKITNEYDGVVHDYTRKRGIVHSEIMLSENAPSEFECRTTLWNAVEKIENAKNSQLAREIEIALPRELNLFQNKNLVREYVYDNFVSEGMCADITIHDLDGSNPHAHIMLTMRPFNEDKSWGAKSKKEYMLDGNGERVRLASGEYKSRKVNVTNWNDRDRAEVWRGAWAEAVNGYLERYDHPDRIDHRSLKRQGIVDQIPTVHLGVAAYQMEEKGIRTERGNINRQIETSNHKIHQFNEEILSLQNKIDVLQNKTLEIENQISKEQSWLAEEEVNTDPPTFADFISDILAKQSQSFIKPQFAAQIFDFLKAKNIDGYEDIEQYIKNLLREQRTITNGLTPIKKKLAEINGNQQRIEVYQKHKDKHDQYQKDLSAQMPWKKKAFEREYGWIVGVFNNAKDEVEGLRNDNGKFPTGAWERERKHLTVKVQTLNKKYQSLKSEVDEVHKIRTKIYDVLWQERQRGRVQPMQSQGFGR